MSKYIKLEDAFRAVRDNTMPLDCGHIDRMRAIADLPTIEVSEENELKFYYVESIDDYWIGQRLDNFYYAEWSDRLGFVWTHSRYLPFGEHVVAPDTLWKEHTYPSEPREIPFTEWIVGFMKKYGSKVSEDCISREGLLKSFGLSEKTRKYGGDHSGYNTMMLYEIQDYIEDAPSVVPSRAEGEWGLECDSEGEGDNLYRCSKCGCEYGCQEYDLPNYCPNCGSKMKG